MCVSVCVCVCACVCRGVTSKKEEFASLVSYKQTFSDKGFLIQESKEAITKVL